MHWQRVSITTNQEQQASVKFLDITHCHTQVDFYPYRLQGGNSGLLSIKTLPQDKQTLLDMQRHRNHISLQVGFLFVVPPLAAKLDQEDKHLCHRIEYSGNMLAEPEYLSHHKSKAAT